MKLKYLKFYKEEDDIFFFQSFDNEDKLDCIAFDKDTEPETQKRYYNTITNLGFFVVKIHAISIFKIIQKLVESNEYVDLRS